MSMMSEISAAMETAGVLERYAEREARVAELDAEIATLCAAPAADDAEYVAQLEELRWLRRERRQVKNVVSRMLDAYAGQVARAGV